jgi:hypothetical protein
VSRRTEPPSGWPPPESALLAGVPVALGPLAEAVADRYFAAFPEDLERYGRDVARAWEVHDTRHVLNWAIADAQGYDDLGKQIDWLASVLDARGFPLEHLAANLELAANVVTERVAGGDEVAQRLQAAAQRVRAAGT